MDKLAPKPVIGIVPLVDEEKESLWMLPGYMEGILQAGGIPVMLPLSDDKEILRQLAGTYDGFLFTGGQDISPEMYGEKKLSVCGKCCDERDKMESVLFPIIYEMDKPLLGICRGIQVINTLLKGTLYQDIITQNPSDIEHHQLPPYNIPVHDVKIVKNTPLYKLLRKDVIKVNSYHHQAINILSSNLKPMAYSTDGLVEAVYAPEKKFIWAIQWHPEFLFKKDVNSRELFRNFIESCK